MSLSDDFKAPLKSLGDIHYIGPGLEHGPLPAFIYFTMSHRDSLLKSPYNQCLTPFYGAPVRVFSWDLPYHPVGIEPKQGIINWKEALDRGEPLFSSFIEQSLHHLETLRPSLIEGALLVGGLSRGAFASFCLAGATPLINGVVAFAPLVDFFGHSAPIIKNKWVRGFISFHDELVHTEKVVRYFQNLSSKERGISSDVELQMYPQIGHLGHGTPEDIFVRGGSLALQRLSP